MLFGLLGGDGARSADGAPPTARPPARTASCSKRTQWSEQYVNWVLDRLLRQGALPTDVHSTHDYEVEFNSCVLDPPTYETQTQAELDYEVRRLQARGGKRR